MVVASLLLPILNAPLAALQESTAGPSRRLVRCSDTSGVRTNSGRGWRPLEKMRKSTAE